MEGNLLDFNWEEQDSYFGIPAEKVETEVSQVIKEIKKEEDDDLEDDDPVPTPKPKSKKKEEVEEEEEDDYFPTGDGNKGPTSTGDQGIVEESTAMAEFQRLKSVGRLRNIELEEDEEIDEDRLAELEEEDYELEIKQRLTAWATEELDEDAKAFIKFKKEGGNTQDFFAAYSRTSDLPQGSIEDEDYQDEVIRYQLSEEGWDRDEIEDRLEYLTSSSKKKKVAEKYDVKVKAEDAARKEAVLKQAETQRLQAKKNEDEFKSEIKEALTEADEIEGFKISKQDKTDIYNFLTRKDHKVGGDRTITSFQKKLAEIFQDTNKTILLAKLIQSDFDMSGFEKKVKTKQTREIKSKIEQRQGMRPNSGSSLGNSSLADLFN